MPLTIDVDSLEFAVLTEQSGVSRVPTVTAFRHYGTAVPDVPGTFEAAEQRCRDRGMLDLGGRVTDEVRETIEIYARANVEFDLRFSTEQGAELRAAVSRSGRDEAVRTVVDGDRVYLERVRPGEIVPALISVLPQATPVRMQPIGLDLEAIRSATAEHGEDTAAVESALRSRGVDLRQYRMVTRLLDGPKLGAGQMGVTTWGRGRKEHRGEQTVQVYDVPAGRLAVYNSRGTRMIAGADPGTFNRVLGDIAEDTRRRTEW